MLASPTYRIVFRIYCFRRRFRRFRRRRRIRVNFLLLVHAVPFPRLGFFVVAFAARFGLQSGFFAYSRRCSTGGFAYLKRQQRNHEKRKRRQWKNYWFQFRFRVPLGARTFVHWRVVLVFGEVGFTHCWGFGLFLTDVFDLAGVNNQQTRFGYK